MTDKADTELDAAVERIDALEMRIAYQDQAIEDLNTVLTEQWAKLSQCLRQIDRLEERIREVQAGVGQTPEDEPPPPHY